MEQHGDLCTCHIPHGGVNEGGGVRELGVGDERGGGNDGQTCCL